jgi:hypothetical protein
MSDSPIRVCSVHVRSIAHDSGYHELASDAASGTITFLRPVDGQLVKIFGAGKHACEPYMVSVQQTSREIFHNGIYANALATILQSTQTGGSLCSPVQRPHKRPRPESAAEIAVEQSLHRLKSEKEELDAIHQTQHRLLAQLQGAAPEVILPMAEPMSLTGLFVYEVVVDEALVVRSEARFDARTEHCVSGGELVACDRRVRVGQSIFVRLCDGRGWLFEEKNGERCLRSVEVEHGLFVYRVVSPSGVGWRNNPSTSDHARMSSNGGPQQGDTLTADCLVRHRGNTFVRVRDNASGPAWLFETKGTERMLEQISLEYGKFIYQITNSVGLVLRQHPNHESDKLEEHSCTVPDGALVTSNIRVDGAHGDKCIYVERNGKSGWLFATRDSHRTMKQLTARPTGISGSAGSRTQVMLGPSAGSWILLFNYHDGDSMAQKHFWSGVPHGLANQINNCSAKGRYVTTFAASSDNDWFVHGRRYDGSGGHMWWSGGNPWLAGQLEGEKDEVNVTMQYDEYDGLKQLVIIGSNGWASTNVGSGLTDEVKKVNTSRGTVKKVFLLPDGNWYINSDVHRSWFVISNEHLKKELKASSGTVHAVTVSPDGSWLVVYDRRYVKSTGVPEELSRHLADMFAKQNAVIDKRSTLISEYDAALRSLSTASWSFNGPDWSMTRIVSGHPKYDSVVAQFAGCWHKAGTPRVHHILQIRNPTEVYEAFSQYAERCGNVCRRFHGTSTHADCLGGLDLGAKPCQRKECAVCNICRVGFSLERSGSSTSFSRFGKGSYFSATSGKSHDYSTLSEKAVNGTRMRLMFLCKVAVGRAYRTQEDRPDLIAPPAGFDSVVGVPGKRLNYDECVVYDEHAAMPSYLIAYSVN